MESLCFWVYVLLFLVQYSTSFSLINNNASRNHVCRQDESRLLLQLKQEFPPLSPLPQDYYRTKYWKESRDCCQWDGVTCDHFNGHVIGLDLSPGNMTWLYGELKSNSSLFHLIHLRRLNLAYNYFSGSAIPSEFGRLSALTHLNLSYVGVVGELPMEFYHLSNLLSLDLNTFLPSDVLTEDPRFLPTGETMTVRCDVKMLFENMTRLRVLLLSGQNLSDSELPMNMSSFLTHLDLYGTGIQGNLPATIYEKPGLRILNLGGNVGVKGSLPKSHNWSNVHSINILDLAGTSISGRLPDDIGFMTSLNYLDLSNSRFSGPIPTSIGNITVLTFLDLSNNDFSGNLPFTISNLRHLTSLDLSHNHLQGQLPNALSSFQDMTDLHLSNNYLEGRIPSSLTNMSQLINLDISSNALTGPFSSTTGHGLQKLQIMDLSNNSIQGMIPSWLFSLPSLLRLNLTSNRLTGRIEKFNFQTLENLDLSYNSLNIQLQSFYNLSNIFSLLISHNTVAEHDASDIVNATFPNLWSLEMFSCDIKEFPNFLQSNMPLLETLDLSDNNIHGPIPSWFNSNLFQNLTFLNLSYNSLTYARDLPLESLNYLDLSTNSFRGTFPSFICNTSELSILNLSNNKLSGNIPKCLTNSSSLYVLDLRRNEFRGEIPTTIGTMSNLGYLGLNGNHLEGLLPLSLSNCSQLEVIDLGNNMLQDIFPWWLHTLLNLKILILKSNHFHGSTTSPSFTINSFSSLQILDLSYNNFTGLLPEKLFTSLNAIKHQASPDGDGLYMGQDLYYMYSIALSVKGANVEFTKVLKVFTTVDLSCNNFNGSIPESLSNLTLLRLLNLSHNNIHGNIPPALGRMTNLEQLDLSSNQLTGGIPQTLTNLTFLGDLDLSHNHLVGPIPVANQFLTFSNESYVGNSGLCGAPLTKSCGNEKGPPSGGEFEEDEDEEDAFMMGFTWKVVVIGYGCGIVLGFILGSVMLSMEKPKWLLRFVYVEAAIILSKRKKRRRTVQGRR